MQHTCMHTHTHIFGCPHSTEITVNKIKVLVIESKIAPKNEKREKENAYELEMYKSSLEMTFISKRCEN